MFSGALVLVELLEGTDLYYSLLVFAFLMLSVFAFNLARGFSRPSGAYIFFFSVLVVDVGTVFKALLGQPAQSNMDQPLLLISVYVVTMAGMLIAALVSSRVASTVNGLAGLLNLGSVEYGNAALGSFVLFCLISFVVSISAGQLDAILNALSQINQFLPLSIMLGTIAAVQSSGGRRSTSVLTWVAGTYLFIQYGLLAFSKQGMFTSAACWLIGVCWTRYRLRPYQLALLLVFGYVAQTILVPISNLGRNEIVNGSMAEREAIVTNHLSDISALRKRDEQQVSDQAVRWYFGSPRGIFDRLTMIAPDAELISYTADGHYFGYLPLRAYFENWVPHVLDPHKLAGVAVGGNAYAHELGELAEGDIYTGISYSISAEVFHMDGWRGIFLVITPVLMLLFVITDSVCGDLRQQPWGLLPLLVFAHSAPEGGLSGPIWWTFTGNIGVLFTIFFCGYVAPLLGLLLRGDPNAKGGLPLAPATGHAPAANLSVDPA